MPAAPPPPPPPPGTMGPPPPQLPRAPGGFTLATGAGQEVPPASAAAVAHVEVVLTLQLRQEQVSMCERAPKSPPAPRSHPPHHPNNSLCGVTGVAALKTATATAAAPRPPTPPRVAGRGFPEERTSPPPPRRPSLPTPVVFSCLRAETPAARALADDCSPPARRRTGIPARAPARGSALAPPRSSCAVGNPPSNPPLAGRKTAGRRGGGTAARRGGTRMITIYIWSQAHARSREPTPFHTQLHRKRNGVSFFEKLTLTLSSTPPRPPPLGALRATL